MMWPPKGRKRRILAIHTHKTRLRMFRMSQSVYTLPASNIKQATEKMWNNPKPFSLFLIVSFLIASMCSCNADDTGGKHVTPPDTTNVVPTAKTVFIYMAAQNSLGARRNQQADSLEIMQAYKDIPGDARILLFIDDKYAPRIYRIDKTTPRPVMVKRWQNDEDSASPAFLGNCSHSSRGSIRRMNTEWFCGRTQRDGCRQVWH